MSLQEYSIYDLHKSLKQTNKTNEYNSADLIDKKFVITSDFITKYADDVFFDILLNYDYTVSIMKEKVYKYLNHVENQIDTSLNNCIFNPFVITYSNKGKPVYEQEKYYDGGNRRYSYYISCYEYCVKNTTCIDNVKIKNIKRLFRHFFYLKSLFKFLPKECEKLIFDYSRDRQRIPIINIVISDLKQVIYKDTKSKYKNY